ncbi:hypothetical protein [Cedratvirus kamchatka]|uniref:Uncharacterized protein n=1 Tax=Cedratvirus kamchatka TaxID=2716914 RepID=A0A6G8MY98_9VIRU|nr:hypothetical protein [Cedratvirus kamchatka]
MDTFYLGVALEEGDLEGVKKYKHTGYSLYAKQMAEVNANQDCLDYVLTESKQRNNTGVLGIHCRYTKKEGKLVWDDNIPEEFRERFFNECAQGRI